MPPNPQPRADAPLRRAGLLLIIAGAAFVLTTRYGGFGGPVLETTGLSLMAAGWVMFAGALYIRYRNRQGRGERSDPARSADDAP